MLMKKIARWARQRIEQIPAAARFELWHCQEIGEPIALCKIQCGQGSAEDRAHEVASQFFDAADDHSKAFDSNQRYKIAAFDLSDDELAIYVFATGSGISSPSVARAEVGEPTEKGLLAQFAPEVVKKLTLAPRPAPALPAAQPSPLETAHEKMRAVWRILDREWLRSHLDADNLARVESLLGAGLPLANVEEFGTKLRELWESLPLDVSEELQAMIFSRDPGLASELVGFLPSASEAAE